MNNNRYAYSIQHHGARDAVLCHLCWWACAAKNLTGHPLLAFHSLSVQQPLWRVMKETMSQLGVVMSRYNDVIDEFAMLDSADLDMEDLALIESIVDTLEKDHENGKPRRSVRWELEEMIDEF